MTTHLSLNSAFERGLASSFRSSKFIIFFEASSREWTGDRVEAQCLREHRVFFRAFDRVAAEFDRCAV